jgi:hypothetical protein
MQFIKLTCIATAATSIQGWTLGVGSKTLQAPYVFGAVTLNPGQSLYLINGTTTPAAFKAAYGLSYLDPTAVVVGSFNASTLRAKITLRQAVPGENFTVNVDGVPLQDFAFLPAGKKRDVDQTNPTPFMLSRVVTAGVDPLYAGDPAAWNVTQPPAPFPPVNCTLTQWTPFSPCTLTCAGGTSTRTRTITAPAEYGGLCDATNETVPCNTQPCPIDCKWNDWEGWSACTQTCGSGSTTRVRSVNVSAMFGGAPCNGSGTDTVPCNTPPCPIDCVGDWGAWPACDCLTSKQTRTYAVSVPAQFGGRECNATNGQNETQSCVVVSCVPVACVGAWSAFGNCSCTLNTQVRTYEVSVPSANGGPACPTANGATESQSCVPQNCPIDCVGTWTVWPACDCASMSMTRSYQISTPAQNGGVECSVVGGENQTQACTPVSCDPVVCVGSWSTWSTCACSTLTSNRFYTVSTAAANGGTPCPVADQASETKACTCDPVDCVGDYDAFTTCDCTTNTHSRTFKVTAQAQFGGKSCVAADGAVDTQSCTCGPPVDCEGGYPDFPPCDCDTNTTTRNYTITRPAEGTGAPCPDLPPETQPCNCEASK